MDLEKMKEELLEVQAEIKRKTDKYNKSVEKLVEKEKTLKSDIEKSELLDEATQFKEIKVICAQVGLTVEEVKAFIEKQGHTIKSEQ